jgi:monofunctional chorismate mutase
MMAENDVSRDLGELRNKIDRADQMLLTSFVTRMRIVKEVAEYKKKNGIAVFDPEREKEKLDEIRRISPDDMEESCVMLYNKIMEISKDFQGKIVSE